MLEEEQTAQQAWQALETFWSPFSFLLEPGATQEQIDIWEDTEGVTLKTDVRALIGVHGSVGKAGGSIYQGIRRAGRRLAMKTTSPL